MNWRRSGFTLIELMVVVAIITLLVGILLPSLSSARRQAKAAVCMANLKRLGTGANLYLAANRDSLPPFRLKQGRPKSTEDYVNAYGRAKPRWHWFLDAEEVGPVINPDPFLDEIESNGSFGDNSTGAEAESGREMTNNYFICPSLGGEFAFDVRNGAYGYNYQYLGNSRSDNDPDRWDHFPVSLHRIRTSGRTVLFADSRGAGKYHGKHSYSLDPPRLAVERNAERFGPGADDVEGSVDPEQYAYSPVEMRHGNRGQVVFMDAHAEAMTLEDLGYQADEHGVAVPILDPEGGTYSASNKLWNGEGRDALATKHRR